MKTPTCLLPFTLLCAAAAAQTVAIFPDEYVDVPDGPSNSPNLPLANGTSRVQILYETSDLQIPSGHQITKLGFRQDSTLTTLDTGRITNLEIRMATAFAYVPAGRNLVVEYRCFGNSGGGGVLANDPINADIYVSSQALFLDLFAPGGMVFTRGAQVLTGARPRTAIVSANGPPTTAMTGSVQQFYCPVAFFEHQ